MRAQQANGWRRITAALLTSTLSLAAVGCGLLDDGSEGAEETTDTIVAARPVEMAALQALLPPAADIGPGYVEEAEDPNQPGGDDAIGDMLDAELRENCAEAAEVMGAEDDGPAASSAKRTYQGPAGEHFGVSFENDEEITDRAAFLAMIDAAKLCGSIELTHPENGVEMRVTMDAELDDTYGDWGGILRMNLTQQHPSFPAPISMWFEYRMFLVGSVGVTISAGDSFDPAGGRVVPRHTERVEALAASFEMTVAALQMQAAAPTTAAAP